jgi:Uncharacterised protein family (UPF0149)
MADEMVTDRLAELREAGEMRDAALEVMRYRMLQETGTGAALVRRVGATEESELEEEALALLASTLEAAKLAAENDHLGGQRFLDETRAEIEAMRRSGPLAQGARLSLARAFVRAGLAAPPALLLDDGASDLPEGSYPPTPPQIEALFDQLSAEAEELADAHAELKEVLGAMPPGARDAMVAGLARRDDPLSAGVATYFLLDGDDRLRRAAAEGVLDRIEAGGIDAATAGRLAMLRPWLPADHAREAVDRALKAAATRQAFGGVAPVKWKLGNVLGSIPDGVGAMSFAVPAQVGRRRAIGMLLLKQGFGVKDAYVLPCADAAEQRRILDTITVEMDAVKVRIDHVAEMLAIALAEGLDAGLPPAPGLVDVVELAGIGELRPQARSVADIVEGFGVATWTKRKLEEAAESSAFWIDDDLMVENWFEDSSEVRAILEAHAGDDGAAEEAIRGHLEGRRGWWSRIIAFAALTKKSARDRTAAEFAAVAHLIESGAPLAGLPIMDVIAEATVAAGEREEWSLQEGEEPDDLTEPDEDPAPWEPRPKQPEKPGELGRILAGSELSPAWLDGYLMAVLVAPKMVRPGDWVGELMRAGPVLPDIEAAQRYLDLVTARSNATVADLDDEPERLKARVAGIAAEDLPDWARGFSRMVRRFGSAWRDKSVRKDDKAMLSLIEAVGNGDPVDLRPLLAEWLGRRRAAMR